MEWKPQRRRTRSHLFPERPRWASVGPVVSTTAIATLGVIQWEWRLRRHRWSSPHPRRPRDSLSRSSSSVGVRPLLPVPSLLRLPVRLHRPEQRSDLLPRLLLLQREYLALDLQLAPRLRPWRLGSRIMSRSAAGGRRFLLWHLRSSGTLPSSKRSIKLAREPTGESRDLFYIGTEIEALLARIARDVVMRLLVPALLTCCAVCMYVLSHAFFTTHTRMKQIPGASLWAPIGILARLWR